MCLLICVTALLVALFQFGADYELRCAHIPANAQQVSLAADLTILHVRLPRARTRIDICFVPLATTSTLITCLHHGPATADVSNPVRNARFCASGKNDA